MNTEHRNFLKVNHKKLAQLIDLNQLMISLIPQKVFTRHMLEDIYSGQTETDRKHSLLLELRTRGPNAFLKFVEALELSGHTIAADLFKKCSEQGIVEVDVPLMSVQELWPSSLPSDSDDKRIKTKKERKNKGHEPSGEVGLYQISVKPAMKLMQGEKVYKMTSKPRGLCLLINNVKFLDDKDERKGSDRDAENLDMVFTELGYKVVFRSDLTGAQMENEFLIFSRRHEHWSYDSAIIIILTHGNTGILYGTDKEIVYVKEVKRYFNNVNCPALQRKPKMFFIQACRGSTDDIGVPEGGERADALPFNNTDVKKIEKPDSDTSELIVETEESSKRMASLTDMLVSDSTVEGNISIRHETLGAWYCQELVRVLQEKACDTSLREMLDEVNEAVENRTSHDGGKQATSCNTDGWKKKLYFNPKIEA